jgi:sporulation-control protein spo0M
MLLINNQGPSYIYACKYFKIIFSRWGYGGLTMGLFDKLKGAVNAVTGGGADVSIEYPTGYIYRGQPFNVKVTVRSTGGEIKSEGVFVDVKAREEGKIVAKGTCPTCQQQVNADNNVNRETFDQQFPIAGAFTLQANETKVFEGQISLPTSYQPSYQGTLRHQWEMRGRLEAFGNDPDSGFRAINVQ